MPRKTTEQLNLYTAKASNLYRALELSVFEQIAKRLKFKGNESILEWQARAMSDLGLINNHTIKELSAVSGRSVKQIELMLEEVGYSAVTDIDKVVKDVGYVIKDTPNNIDNIMRAYAEQTFLELDNFVNQTLVTTNFGTGKVTQMYQDIINKTMAEFNTGILTRQQALEKTILQWADKGIPSSFVDKGGNIWSLERYVDMVLKSTLNDTYNQLRTERMADYGIHTVIMTTVYDAAERCAHCQGKVLDMRNPSESEYPSIYNYGYGQKAGTLGINCRHDIIPFIPGVNTNNQRQIDPKLSIERSAVRAQQRNNERRIVRTKKKLIITKELGSPRVEHYSQLLRKQQLAQRELLAKADWLSRDYGREKVYTPKEVLMKGSL